VGRSPKLTDVELLDRAVDTFWVRGVSSVSIRDLEAVAGVKAPSIYRRFGSMDELRTAALERYVDRVIAPRVSRLLSGDGDPIENITTFLVRSVTEAADGGGLIGCLITTASVEESRCGSEEARAAGTRGLEIIEAGFVREVTRAHEEQMLAVGLSPSDGATTIALAFQGLMVLARSGRSPAALRSHAKAAVATITAKDARAQRPKRRPEELP
jgi:TetR/AcrR family transcriptional repressor of nem operon